MLVLTFDTDWAPQFVLDHVLGMAAEAGVAATAFCTGPCDLPPGGKIEAALHPNFLPGSTQGENEDQVLDYLQGHWPGAVGMRSHSLYWHSGLYQKLNQRGLIYDSSLIMPLHPGLLPVKFRGVTRFPIWWSEGVLFRCGLGLEAFDPPGLGRQGLKVLLFHPIHVYLNTSDLDSQRVALNRLGRLPELSREDLEPLRRQGPGVGTVFRSCLEALGRQGETRTLKELAGEA